MHLPHDKILQRYPALAHPADEILSPRIAELPPAPVKLALVDGEPVGRDERFRIRVKIRGPQ